MNPRILFVFAAALAQDRSQQPPWGGQIPVAMATTLPAECCPATQASAQLETCRP
jgi:hypothetical protein